MFTRFLINVTDVLGLDIMPKIAHRLLSVESALQTLMLQMTALVLLVNVLIVPVIIFLITLMLLFLTPALT